jgi:hypothetical protein
MYFLQAGGGDVFSLVVPQHGFHESFHVYCYQTWDGGEFLLKVLLLQLELHCLHHG